MAQITTGIRSILSNPLIYEVLQKIMGVDRLRKNIVKQYVTPHSVKSILDIGCGPAEILKFLPEVEYYGFDISTTYIDTAKNDFNDRGVFYARQFTADELDKLPKFDLVLMLGILHHLDDKEARGIITLSKSALKDGGRLLAIDPVFTPKQNPVARYLVSKDRGQNVRTEQEYVSLTDGLFSLTNVELFHETLIPYTRCLMECTR